MGQRTEQRRAAVLTGGRAARPFVLTDDERAVIEAVGYHWRLRRVVANPAAGIEDIRTSHERSGDAFGTTHWVEGSAIVCRWYDPVPVELGECPATCGQPGYFTPAEAWHRGGAHVKRWSRDDGPIRTAKLTHRRLAAWAEQLPDVIRNRARVLDTDYQALVRDALAGEVHYAGQPVGQEALF